MKEILSKDALDELKHLLEYDFPTRGIHAHAVIERDRPDLTDGQRQQIFDEVESDVRTAREEEA